MESFHHLGFSQTCSVFLWYTFSWYEKEAVSHSNGSECLGAVVLEHWRGLYPLCHHIPVLAVSSLGLITAQILTFFIIHFLLLHESTLANGYFRSQAGVIKRHFRGRQVSVSDSDVIKLCAEMIWLLDDAVMEGHAVASRFLHGLLLTVAELSEGCTEFLGHEIVNHWVDGTVEINANSAKEQEPIFLERAGKKWVDNHKSSVGHP